ncbi:MAG: hypothetical protein C6Y22_19465 [Hapalosiphonaceae cyanobacterium JJU2]|nr:MAG: hypothetical protein C6Y22_19465 [Hapalosiphonaceae cyanobacterium JJU2]
MSISTPTKTLLGGIVTATALLTFAGHPALANTANQTVEVTKANTSTNRTNLAKEQINQTIAQTSPTPQPTNEKGCACCKSMMNNQNNPSR